MLRIEIQRTPHTEMWILYGALAGDIVDELTRAWKKERSELNGRKCVIDLIEVTSVDKRGELALLEMMRDGVRFIARGVYSTNLLKNLRACCKQDDNRAEGCAKLAINTKQIGDES
jgi:ABC-type transporter Mla MlaB component